MEKNLTIKYSQMNKQLMKKMKTIKITLKMKMKAKQMKTIFNHKKPINKIKT